tara:strand:- start:27 stop:728 length:702 start_codon:yes stop_codon:yes gene_type:complete
MNIYTNPSSGIIEFNTGATSGNYLDSSISGASRFTFENSGELNLASYGTGVPEKFTIDSQSGRLFTIDTSFDSVFSANDVAGLPILEVYSNGSVVMGDYNSGDFVLTGNQLGIGTSAPASKLHVNGAVTSTTTMTTVTGTAYTFVLSDQSNMVATSNHSGVTLTIPINTGVAFPVGTEIAIFQSGSGQATVTGAAGVGLYAADSEKTTRVRYSAAMLYQVATDNWLLVGDLTS